MLIDHNIRSYVILLTNCIICWFVWIEVHWVLVILIRLAGLGTFCSSYSTQTYLFTNQHVQLVVHIATCTKKSLTKTVVSVQFLCLYYSNPLYFHVLSNSVNNKRREFVSSIEPQYVRTWYIDACQQMWSMQGDMNPYGAPVSSRRQTPL